MLEGVYLNFGGIEVLQQDNFWVSPNLSGLKPETVFFKFETGDRVHNRVNGKTGIVTTRRIDPNRCISYWFENGEQNQNGELLQFVAFEQELELVDRGLNAPEQQPMPRRKTGCGTFRRLRSDCHDEETPEQTSRRPTPRDLTSRPNPNTAPVKLLALQTRPALTMPTMVRAQKAKSAER